MLSFVVDFLVNFFSSLIIIYHPRRRSYFYSFFYWRFEHLLFLFFVLLLVFFPVFPRFFFFFFFLRRRTPTTTPYTHTHSTVRVVYIFGTIIDPSRSSGGVAEGSSQWSTTSGSHPNYSTPPTPHYTTAICSSLFLVLSFFF